jgi:hypothetical protein
MKTDQGTVDFLPAKYAVSVGGQKIISTRQAPQLRMQGADMTQYYVLRDSDIVNLERRVTEHLLDGWTLIGGIAINANDDNNVEYFHQAIAK